MAATFDVLSYGTIGMDVILKVPHWPGPDLSTHSLSAIETLGGKATNAATHLATWGLSVAISGTTVGDDEMGRRLLSSVGKIHGIDTRYLGRQAGLKSMYCIILVTPDGERAIVGVHTDSVIPTPPTRDMIASARLLTLDLYGGSERVEAASLARDAGIPVVVGDLRWFDHAVLPYTSTAIASLAELQQEYPDQTPEDCARLIQSAGAKSVIITSGAGAVLTVDENGERARFNSPRVKVVDTTGAGDAFRAGVVYGILAGYSTLRAAMVGAAAGALVVGRLGAATDPAALDEVVSLAGSLQAL